MILGQTPSVLLGCRFSRACGCFQPLGRGKNREGRPASSTAKSRARQGAGPPAIVRETAKNDITLGHREKYETNQIPSKPIAINELRFVLRA